MNINSFEMAVAIPSRNGLTKIKEFGHGGNTYVESRDSQEFAIIFKNNSASRVLAIPSVDGLCTLDGESATEKSRGYVVPAYSSVEIKGWRTSLEDINAFVFAKKEGSYSEGVGHGTQNCGVIAIKVIAEKQPDILKSIFVNWPKTEHHHHHYPMVPRPYWDYPDIWCGPTDTIRCCADVGGSTDHILGSSTYTASVNNLSLSAEAPEFDMGTAFGKHQKDKIGETDFERGAELATLLVYYASAEKLKAVGVPVDKQVTVSRPLPQAFSAGFCKAPASQS